VIVRYTRRAQNDLRNILNDLEKRSPRRARSVKLAIRRTIDTIGQNPKVGRGRRNLGAAHSTWRADGLAGLKRSVATDLPLCQGLNFRGSNRLRSGASSARLGKASFGKGGTP
jgi:plasmid stabilization system protein ParE